MSEWWTLLLVRALRTLRSVLVGEGDSSKSVVPFIPRRLRLLCITVLLINVRGLPFFWTVRVFRPAIYARIKNRLLRGVFESEQGRRARLRALSPVGVDPFATETVFRTRATPDVSDFNMHLSNSSYATSLDMARFKYFVAHMPLLYVDGGWAALGGTHYSFAREIPLNAKYEVRVSVAGWDNKWIYMLGRFITIPSKRSAAKSKAKSEPRLLELRQRDEGSSQAGAASVLGLPAIVTPADSRSRTPVPVADSPGPGLPEGAVVHCTSISKICFKFGRITIPPGVAMAASGFGITEERFDEIQKWRLEKGGAGIRAFYSGGWREAGEGERWWEEALGGEVERRRVEGVRRLASTIGIPSPDSL